MQHKAQQWLKDIFWISLGSAIFALGFSMFLAPNQIGAGGISGLAMVVNAFIPVITVGAFSVVVNVPLFLAGYRFVGKKFFYGSLLGMLLSSVLIDVFTLLPEVPTEPLLGAIYGGLFVGVGCGIVFMRGASTGGVDIIARLLKFKFRNLSIGKLTLAVDLIIAVITGIAFRDINKILYCIVALFVSSEALDAVVYRFDYSYVAMIITDQDEAIRDAISQRLDRGCTYLKGEGSYTGQRKNVIYCAVKKQQLAEIQELVMETDPSAFLVLQEAHQVLGEGFERYSKHKL
jgi:uncharacterized membrane-anchored protein YitT (DUF2179 family)